MTDLCPRCSGLMYEDSYFQCTICENCGYRIPFNKSMVFYGYIRNGFFEVKKEEVLIIKNLNPYDWKHIPDFNNWSIKIDDIYNLPEYKNKKVRVTISLER